ncbi:MAG: class I SAM-dependent methyltransferase [Verrucomicrobia bacterium]|nr:class I SAM-dependent methyltransferase [Verrucomicrobiota bacterium]
MNSRSMDPPAPALHGRTGKRGLADWLRWRRMYPELRGLAPDDPQITLRQRDVLQKNRAARFSFGQFYRELAGVAQASPPGLRVEIGSGAGFLEEFIPGLVKTDVVPLPFTHQVCRAEAMPFDDGRVGALFMVNVLHHVRRPGDFFREAVRVLAPGGRVAMIEPFNSSFSRFVYRRLHHEPFDPDVPSWDLPEGGRLSAGNNALPWIIFVRDRARFEQEHPSLEIERVRPHSGLVHLLSGGVTTRPFVPAFILPGLAALERRAGRLMRHLALFMTVVLKKNGGAAIHGGPG